MSVCELFETADVEMYFYDELDPVDRARVEAHVLSCADCRQRLDDLHAIRRALLEHPPVDAPPAGDWSGFMRRLDSNLRAVDPPNRRTVEPWNPRTLIPLAAMLVLVTLGVIMAARLSTKPETRVAVATAPIETPVLKPGGSRPDRALREGSAELLERSKLVVLGLATRDPHARSEDWQYERALAGTLLIDTRLYRQAAVQGGSRDVERVMRDLETVLLEASMSDTKDRAALERVQRLIAKRDLVVKMQVMATSGPAGN